MGTLDIVREIVEKPRSEQLNEIANERHVVMENGPL